MTEKPLHVTASTVFHHGEPVLELRVRPMVDDGSVIPKGKVLIERAPISPPGAPDADLGDARESELVDADGADSLCCLECEAQGLGGLDWLSMLAPVPSGGREGPSWRGRPARSKRSVPVW